MKTLICLRFTLKKSMLGIALLTIPALVLAQLTVSITPTNISCFGAFNGQAKANPSGGISPYTYTWSNNSSTQTIDQLAPGNYFVTVTDANQNQAVASTVLSQPAQLGVVVGGQSQLCKIAPDGSAYAVAYGGTSPYAYLWSNGASTVQIGNLIAGTYTATVTDAHGCTNSGYFVIGFWDEGLWLMGATVPANCGYENGKAQVSASTGTPPYTYNWSNGGGNTPELTNLSAGTYTVTVVDLVGCGAASTLIVVSELPQTKTVQLPNPYCLSAPAIFFDTIPDLYPQIKWTLQDTLDHILQGQGTDSISVQWGSTGTKMLKLQYGVDSIYCGTVTYNLKVEICTETKEQALETASVTPNPFSEYLKIATPDNITTGIKASIYDATGNVLANQLIDSPSSILPTTHLPPGFYFLKLDTAGTSKCWKLTKI